MDMKNFLKWMKDDIKIVWPALLFGVAIIIIWGWQSLSSDMSYLILDLKDGSISISCNEGPLVECSAEDVLIQYLDE